MINIKKVFFVSICIVFTLLFTTPFIPEAKTIDATKETLLKSSISLSSVQYGIVDYQIKKIEDKSDTLNNEGKGEKEEERKSEEKAKPLVNNYYSEGNINDNLEQEFIKNINDLPDEIINKFNEEGWTICFTGYTIAGRYYNGSVKGSIAGLTDYNNHIIYISSKDSYPSFKHILYHEIGHFVDKYNDTTSDTEEFIGIYEKEKDNISIKGKSQRQINHAKSSPEEYYAEAFSKMLLNEDMSDLKETEKIINNDIKNLKNT